MIKQRDKKGERAMRKTINVKILSYDILLENGVLCHRLLFDSPTFKPGDKSGFLVVLGNGIQFQQIEGLLKACEVENITELPGRIVSITCGKDDICEVLNPMDQKLIIDLQ